MGSRELRRHIADAVLAGEDLESITETLITPAPVSAEVRDAMWLYAWALAEEHDVAEAPALPALG
jgi:hypothetical protein